MRAQPKCKTPAPDTSGDVWVEIDSFTRKYFISRSDVGADSLIDDEAQLEIEATIKTISQAHKKHLGDAMHISVLSRRGMAARSRAFRYALAH